jgi:hypothetical protein
MREKKKMPGLCLLLGAAVVGMVFVVTTVAFMAPAQKQKQTAAMETATEVQSRAVAGQDVMVTIGSTQVAVDPKTGDLRPLTRAEAKKLAAAMRKMFKSRRIDEPTLRPDGALSAIAVPNVLQFSVARIESDGTVAVGHADGVEKAITFMTENGVMKTGNPNPEEE